MCTDYIPNAWMCEQGTSPRLCESEDANPNLVVGFELHHDPCLLLSRNKDRELQPSESTLSEQYRTLDGLGRLRPS